MAYHAKMSLGLCVGWKNLEEGINFLWGPKGIKYQLHGAEAKPRDRVAKKGHCWFSCFSYFVCLSRISDMGFSGRERGFLWGAFVKKWHWCVISWKKLYELQCQVQIIGLSCLDRTFLASEVHLNQYRFFEKWSCPVLPSFRIGSFCACLSVFIKGLNRRTSTLKRECIWI